MVRPRQLDLQETYPRCAPRVVCAGTDHLRPLPVWIPEVYRLHERTVDVEGYVSLHCNRYSVPISWIGRRVEVRESKDKVEIQLDARNLVTHAGSPRPSTSA